MRLTSKLLALVTTAAVSAASALPSVAEDAAPATPATTAAPTTVRPENGMHMDAVESRYGAPATRYPAVGQPPITRWDYPGFIIYFENDLVLHAVLTGAG